MSDLSSPAYRTSLAIVLIAAASLGLARLSVPSVWLDEASSWYNASGTWGHLWLRAVQGEDTGGLLYSVLLKIWIGVAGTGETALRLPGVALMIALMGALARAVRLAWRRDAAVLVAAVALVHPSLLPAARQARGYILLLFFTALALLALASLLSGRRRARWLLAAASLGAAASHVFGLFVALGAGLCDLLLARADRVNIRLPLTIVPALVFSGAWTLLIQERVQRNLALFWIPGTVLSNYAAISVFLIAPLLVGCAWLLWRAPSPRVRLIVFGLAAMALPIAAGPGLVSLLARGEGHLVLLRYAIALVPLGAVAAGCALATIPRRLSVPLVVLALAGSLGYSVSKNVYAAETRAGQDVRGAAAFLGQEVRAGDLLFVEPAHNWMALAYYGVETAPAEGRGEEWRVVTENVEGRRQKVETENGTVRRSPEGEGGKTENVEGRRQKVETENGKRKTENAKGRREKVEPENGDRTVWLVRFSRRTAVPAELLERTTLAGRFGTLTILKVAPRKQ